MDRIKISKRAWAKTTAGIALVILILSILAIQLGILFTKLIPHEEEKISSGAITATTNGQISLCLNYPANISVGHCSSRAFVNYLYTCTPVNYDTDLNQNYTYTADSTLFDINETTGKINLTANSSQTGDYYINITANDNSGCNNGIFSTYLNLTVAFTSCGDGYCTDDESCSTCSADCGACPSQPSAPPGGGGSGGGDGGMSSVPISNTYAEVTPEKPVIADLANLNTLFTKITVEVNEPVKNVRVSVNGLYIKEQFIKLAPEIKPLPGKVRAYYEIKIDNLKPEQTNRVGIEYRVEKNWLIGAKAAEETVTLFRFDSNDWQKLPTKILKEDTNFVYYSADSTAMSYYAIGIIGFDANIETVHLRLKQGETTEKQLYLENNGAEKLTIKLETEGLQDLLQIDEPEITLGVGEAKTILLRYYAPETMLPGAYVGNLIITSDSHKKIIEHIIEVESKEVFFDISLDIPRRYQELMPGEFLQFDATIYNLKHIEFAQVEVTYLIKDGSGKTILSEKETVSVEEETSYRKKLKLPQEIKPGDYVLVMQTRYDESVGVSTENFKVVAEKHIELPALLGAQGYAWLLLSIIAVIFAIIAYTHIRLRNLERIEAKNISKAHSITKHKYKHPEKATLKKAYFGKQLSLLEHNYRAGFIEKGAYETGMKKLIREAQQIGSKKGKMERTLLPKEYFYLADGKVLKNIYELLEALTEMDEKTFSHHVNTDKNDFANWIRDEFGQKELAEAIYKLKSREDMRSRLLREIIK